MQQPGMPPFSPAAGTPVVGVGVGQHAATPTVAAAPSPISSRPPEGQQQVDELGGSAPAGGGGGIFADHEGTTSAGAGDELGGPSSGNRWPRQETLALLKIRSEMDAAFREAALKGPLWEQVSRKLEAMGYKRSAKKCREKFENVDKYYKRTKDGRAGRGDGKAYRFFSELEALHGASSSPAPHPPPASLAPTPVAMASPATPLPVLQGAPGMGPAMHDEHQPPRVPAAVPRPAPLMGGTTTAPAAAASDAACMMNPGDVSFSSGSDGEDTEDTGGDGGKRKRQGGDVGGSGKMMRFFEGLMRQVMERQEEMQRRFIEAIERREQDRMIREEAWRRQELARLAREQDALAQERAMAASRDAAVVSFIQRVTGHTIPMPSVAPPAFFSALTAPPPLQPTPVASAAPAPAPAQHQHQQPPSNQLSSPKPAKPQPQQHQTPPPPAQPQMSSKEMMIVHAPPAESQLETPGSGGGVPSPSRWPKAEVHALIQLRTELEARYQDSGPKGPLWEDISAGMRRLGYNRSAKRCKEKWENINKYFKKVKESNKKRPEDSKTCPYYHQLEALYRSKAALASSAAGAAAPPRPAADHAAGVTVLAPVPLSQTPPRAEHGGNGHGCAGGRVGSDNGGGSSGGMQTQASNGGAAARFSVEGAGGGNDVATNKPESIIAKETATTTTDQPRPQPVSMNDSYVNDDTVDSDSSMDDDDDEDDFDDEEDGNAGGGGGNSKMQYEIQFQRQQQGQSSGGVGSGPGGPGPAATASGSFLTMVHH